MIFTWLDFIDEPKEPKELAGEGVLSLSYIILLLIISGRSIIINNSGNEESKY